PAIQTKCVHGKETLLMAIDYTNWAPRLGIAWSPTPKWTVRAGGGIFYSQDAGNPVFDAVKNFFSQVTTTASGSEILNYTFTNPFGTAGSNPCGVTLPLVCISSPVVFLNEANRKTPYTAQYTL